MWVCCSSEGLSFAGGDEAPLTKKKKKKITVTDKYQYL